MIKVITYGTYDLLHEGHVNLLRRAKALGDYLIVGVTNDNFDRERGKLNVVSNVLERVAAVQALGIADKIIIEDYVGQKIDDIQKYDVDIFAIGSDWVGAFDYLKEYCDVVYLPRTEGISSTMLRAEMGTTLRLGKPSLPQIHHLAVSKTRHMNKIVLKRPAKSDRAFDKRKICLLYRLRRKLGTEIFKRHRIPGNKHKTGGS